MSQNDAPVLWHLKVSNFNEKARWALDYKRVPHVRRDLTPGRHREVANRLTGSSTFPVLVVDGEAIGDSTRIIAALERIAPDPPLYPADPDERRRALELEDYFDEELGPHVRLALMERLLERPGLFLRTFVPDASAVRLLPPRLLFPRLRRQVITDMGIDHASVERAYGKMRAAGERFRAELRPSGHLVSDEFTVADLTLAALVSPAIAPEQFPYRQAQRGHPVIEPVREALSESGIADWCREMYARHRGISAEIAA